MIKAISRMDRRGSEGKEWRSARIRRRVNRAYSVMCASLLKKIFVFAENPGERLGIEEIENMNAIHTITTSQYKKSFPQFRSIFVIIS